jgi:hypothetical protein
MKRQQSSTKTESLQHQQLGKKVSINNSIEPFSTIKEAECTKNNEKHIKNKCLDFSFRETFNNSKNSTKSTKNNKKQSNSNYILDFSFNQKKIKKKAESNTT